MNRLNPSFYGVRRALTLLTAGLALAASISACGSSTTGDGGATTTDTTIDTLADTAGGTDATSGGTDATADVAKDIKKVDVQVAVDKDNTIETATPLTVASTAAPQNPASDTLDPTGDVDYYSFTGKKGDLIYIYLQAQSLTTAFDPDTLDTILTLYGPDKKQIAFDDDPASRLNNDSELFTYLPADGTYYVRVEECWTWLGAHPEKTGVSCADPKDKGNVDYNIGVATFTDSDPGITLEKEVGDTIKEATEIMWEKNTQGKYVTPTLIGTFKGPVDVDVYHFNVPADMTITSGRSVMYFDLTKGGIDGNGSTALMGAAWIASEATPTAMIAQADLGDGKSTGIAPPLPFGVGYYLFVTRATGAETAAEFYFFDAIAGGSNPVEANDAGNDAPAGAEVVTFKADSGNQRGYFEGDLLKSGADTDWWVSTVPTGVGGGKMYVFCGAQSSGSGLRNFKTELFSDAGTTAIANGSQVEPVDGVYIKDLTTPADGAKLYIKLSAGSQAADVSSTFYRCGVLFQAP